LLRKLERKKSWKDKNFPLLALEGFLLYSLSLSDRCMLEKNEASPLKEVDRLTVLLLFLLEG
jgi:hypothetical protein